MVDGPSDTQQQFLEATHQTVSWFWKRLQHGELEMKPPFQRNPVWQESQKAFLIDTILRGYPVPELYLQSAVNESGDEKYIVVDGQQRIRACLEFVNDGFTLGDDSGAKSGLSFNELLDDDKRRIWGYKFVVRSLPTLGEAEIREIFGRLNKNNVALSRQELRQATYWGEFITSVTEISKKSFWVKSGLFTVNDFRRMLDIEYVSELVVAALFGPQNKKAMLDTYYADFESEFPDRQQVEATFDLVLDELTQLVEWPNKLRWSRKVDFYSLFLVLAARSDEMPFNRDTRDRVRNSLVDFSGAVNRVLSLADSDSAQESIEARSYARGVRNSSDLGSRRLRMSALSRVLWPADAVFEAEAADQREDPLKGLPTVEVLFRGESAEADAADEDDD
ncbi:DUF262 domain-containing protein [Streptomyces sp. NPDC047197]|uniref:DUF262 domain-containing protein n=1 Tax=Streptomyces sp. NPDC047197 TaxID=3155477 RepID=UPI0033D85670